MSAAPSPVALAYYLMLRHAGVRFLPLCCEWIWMEAPMRYHLKERGEYREHKAALRAVLDAEGLPLGRCAQHGHGGAP